MVQIWSKHIRLYSAGIFLLCSSENPLFFLPVNASAVVDSEFRLTKFSFFEQQQISEFLLPRLVLRVVLVFPLAHCMFLCPIFLQEGCVFFFMDQVYRFCIQYLVHRFYFLFYTHTTTSEPFICSDFFFNWIDGHSELYTLLLDKVHVCTMFCVLSFLGS